MDKKNIAVIFDLDGTLLNTLGDLTDSVNHVIASRGFATGSESDVRRFIGNGAKRLVERMMYSKNGELDVTVADPELADVCCEEFKTYYGEHVNVKTAPYAGVIEVLEILYSKGIPMAVVTNKPDASAKKLCTAHFDKYIKIALGDAEGRKRKPDPSTLLETIGELGCDSAIYVGDSEVDIKVARNAKIPSVILTWGFRDRQLLEENGAEILVDDAQGLLCALSDLLGIDLGEL